MTSECYLQFAYLAFFADTGILKNIPSANSLRQNELKDLPGSAKLLCSIFEDCKAMFHMAPS
jgi:hypothetical protein